MPATGVSALGGLPIQARPTSSTADQIRSAWLRRNSVLKQSDNDSRGSKGKQPLPQQTEPVTPQRLKEGVQRKRRGRKRQGMCQYEYPNGRSHVQVNPYANGESSYNTARMLPSYTTMSSARPERRGCLKRKTVVKRTRTEDRRSVHPQLRCRSALHEKGRVGGRKKSDFVLGALAHRTGSAARH